MMIHRYAEDQDTHPGLYLAAGFALLGKITSFVYSNTAEEKLQQCKVMEWDNDHSKCFPILYLLQPDCFQHEVI